MNSKILIEIQNGLKKNCLVIKLFPTHSSMCIASTGKTDSEHDFTHIVSQGPLLQIKLNCLFTSLVERRKNEKEIVSNKTKYVIAKLF